MEEKNKYQEALEEIINEYQYAYKWYCQFEGISEKRAKELFENFSNKKIGLLKELVNKETPIAVRKRLIIKAISPVHDTVISVGTCLNCGEEDLKVNFSYCPSCGQKLKWERDE